MASTARSLLRKDLKAAVGDLTDEFTSDSGSSTTSVETQLANLGFADDVFNQYWVYPTSGTPDEEERRASDYVDSSTTLTWIQALSASMATETFELSLYRPTDYHNAIDQAIRSLGRWLWLPLTDETIIVDNQLLNSDFETFSGGFTNWTEVGSPTVTQETSIVLHGTQAAKVVASGADGQLTQAPTINIPDLGDRTATHKRWCFATAADAVRARVDFGSTILSSPFHPGDSSWRLLEIDGSAGGATQVKAICEVVDGNTGYFDLGWLEAGGIHRYAIPSAFIDDPRYVTEQHNQNNPEGPYYPMRKGGRPTAGSILRLEGKGRLTVPTADAGTVEVDRERAQLIVQQAKVYLGEMLGGRTNNEKFDRWVVDGQRQLDRLLGTRGIPMTPLSASIPVGYEVDEDSSGPVLVLKNAREGVSIF